MTLINNNFHSNSHKWVFKTTLKWFQNFSIPPPQRPCLSTWFLKGPWYWTYWFSIKNWWVRETPLHRWIPWNTSNPVYQSHWAQRAWPEKWCRRRTSKVHISYLHTVYDMIKVTKIFLFFCRIVSQHSQGNRDMKNVVWIKRNSSQNSECATQVGKQWVR